MERDATEVGCAYVRQHLDDFLDQESPGDEARAILDHLSRCADCAARYQQAYLALAQFRQAVQNVTAPDGLMTRVVQHMARAREA
jgi:anti-sigma factor (TIGR02949 family)